MDTPSPPSSVALETPAPPSHTRSRRARAPVKHFGSYVNNDQILVDDEDGEEVGEQYELEEEDGDEDFDMKLAVEDEKDEEVAVEDEEEEEDDGKKRKGTKRARAKATPGSESEASEPKASGLTGCAKVSPADVIVIASRQGKKAKSVPAKKTITAKEKPKPAEAKEKPKAGNSKTNILAVKAKGAPIVIGGLKKESGKSTSTFKTPVVVSKTSAPPLSSKKTPLTEPAAGLSSSALSSLTGIEEEEEADFLPHGKTPPKPRRKLGTVIFPPEEEEGEEEGTGNEKSLVATKEKAKPIQLGRRKSLLIVEIPMRSNSGKKMEARTLQEESAKKAKAVVEAKALVQNEEAEEYRDENSQMPLDDMVDDQPEEAFQAPETLLTKLKKVIPDGSSKGKGKRRIDDQQEATFSPKKPRPMKLEKKPPAAVDSEEESMTPSKSKKAAGKRKAAPKTEESDNESKLKNATHVNNSPTPKAKKTAPMANKKARLQEENEEYDEAKTSMSPIEPKKEAAATTPTKRKHSAVSDDATPASSGHKKKNPGPIEKVSSAHQIVMIDALLTAAYTKSVDFASLAQSFTGQGEVMTSAKLSRHWREVLSKNLKDHLAGAAKTGSPSKGVLGLNKEHRLGIWHAVCEKYDGADWKTISVECDGMTIAKLKKNFREVLMKEGKKMING